MSLTDESIPSFIFLVILHVLLIRSVSLKELTFRKIQPTTLRSILKRMWVSVGFIYEQVQGKSSPRSADKVLATVVLESVL